MSTGRKSGRRAQREQNQTLAWERVLTPRVIRLLPVVLAGFAFVVYLFTMAPRLTWEHAGRDGGDLITAAWYMGVPHPTGYPTYTLLAALFARLPMGSIAWRVHLFSGLTSAVTVALVFLIGRRLARRQAEPIDAPATLGAAVGALLLAFSRLFWGHALIAEVYALHLFFIALVLWLMLRWRDGEGALPWAALAFGLGMGNHITLTFLGPVILLLLWSGRDRLTWRGVLLSALALMVGLLVYLYLPLSAATDPLINWGDPDTREGFEWVVTGEGYRRFFFALPYEKLSTRLDDWRILTGAQFTILAWPLAVLGMWELTRRYGLLALGTFLHAAINLVYSIGYNTTDAFVLMLPVYFYVALWMGQGAGWFLDVVKGWRRWDWRSHSPRRPVLVVLLTVCVCVLPLISLVKDWTHMDLTDDHRAEDWAKGALEAVEPGSLILVGADAYTFALWYYHDVEGVRPDVTVVNEAMYAFEWYQRTLAVHNPDVPLPSSDEPGSKKVDQVLRNLDRRAVYITEDEDNLPGLELTPVGEVWRVTMEKTPTQ